jgi:hypothetical protein
MSKSQRYQQTLQAIDDWVPFLKENSGLPGPRGNLELAHTVAETGTRKQFEYFLTFDGKENTPEVFVVFCGVLGLGKLALHHPELFDCIRSYASDPRWRIREAVPTGLQLTGDQNMELLVQEMKKWIRGNWYEKRAAAAALAEPRLLKQTQYAKQVLQILDTITASMETEETHRDDGYRVLRQGMGYCWSVAVVALPDTGKPIMEKWLESNDKDILWIMKENLKKNRLAKMDAEWVNRWIKMLKT